MAAGMVQALRDFTYDEKVGNVKTGQVFKLGNHINDKSLQKHGFFIPYTGKLSDLHQDDKGRRFAEEWQRTRAGDQDAVPAAEVLADRRARVAQRVVNVGG